MFKELQGRGIKVDVLVNNAGFGANGAFARMPLPRQLAMIQVNITALTDLTGLFLPGMIERRSGGVLNVGSLAGFLPGPGMAVYYCVQSLRAFIHRGARKELAGTGVTATALCPGPTATNFGNVSHGQKDAAV